MADKQIKVKFTGDASQFDKEADKAKGKIEGVTSTAQKSGEKMAAGMDKAAASVGRVGDAAKAVGDKTKSAGKDFKSFNEMVAEGGQKAMSFWNGADSVFGKIGTKLVGAAGTIGLITQGLKAWGEVIKTLAFDLPLEGIKNYVEAAKREIESMRQAESVNKVRRDRLSKIAEAAGQVNAMPDIKARRMAAERLIAQAQAQYGEGHGLSYNYATNRLEGVEQFDVAVSERNARELAQAQTELAKLKEENRRIRGEKQFIDEGFGGSARSDANPFVRWQMVPLNYYRSKYYGKEAEQIQRELDANIQAQAMAVERIQSLKASAPVETAIERSRNKLASAAVDRTGNVAVEESKAENERLMKQMADDLHRMATGGALVVKGSEGGGR